MADMSKNSLERDTLSDGDGQTFRCPHRILVVDDNKDAADSMKVLLELMDAEVRTAYDGLTAFQVASAFRPRVVLMDIQIPKLDGYETARRIRAQEWGKRTVVVAFTGWAREEDRIRCEEAGFDGHLSKPVQIASLASLLEKLLSAADRKS